MFSCLSYVHNDSANRAKIDSKSKKCFFISYDDNEFKYHLWNDQNKKKIIKSKDVIFNVQTLYKDRLRAKGKYPKIKKIE